MVPSEKRSLQRDANQVVRTGYETYLRAPPPARVRAACVVAVCRLNPSSWARLLPHRDALGTLLADGAKADIFCYWLGRTGPMLPARQLKRLAEVEIDVGFDVYFDL